MERVSVQNVVPTALRSGVDRRALTDPLGATDVAINRYRLEPGRRLAGLHVHPNQEEVFVVTEGELTFETFAR